MSGNFTVEVKVKAKFTLIIETRVALALPDFPQIKSMLSSILKKRKEKKGPS